MTYVVICENALTDLAALTSQHAIVNARRPIATYKTLVNNAPATA